MTEGLRELYRYRDLFYTIACRDIKVRYKQSAMGFLWALLMPVLIVGAGITVRYGFAIASGKHLDRSDIAAVAVKSVPWAFLVSSIRFSCMSLTNNTALVTKIYFPKEIFPLAAVLACLFDFAVASAALVVVLLVLKIGWSVYLLYIPFLIMTMTLLVAGISMIVSAGSLFFRDVKYIVEAVLTFAIFFTPVFYDVRMFGDKGKWLMLNPAAPILDSFSDCVAHQQCPDLSWLAYSVVFALVTFVAGYSFFKRLEPAFAESI
ncbi:MAG TPA: ABC transporter permease [Verrucomicrobiae bacterium]|jgi:ABC-type polysaccharide/polyol phosphate export permease|nr:ABC transporter permease [Verrucomicrobiae bacterium]